ncbi:molybdopterin converting factor subunit 1 [Sulfurirhabdus autotrophica]|uniref:Molybdopterin synthase sulfur carrier subunit n=1 Tax=Sulfurirhabdus autotrophica TaxID=1706046 RepID=A0A4R3Y3F9_9PROT|nr:molybdopterin converting factor subunit 1 [Sulfurirhabdus autotrophica]TCV86735.1 molybdopterin synthase subunit MoaD [Sulfurirhabdus autotrophica]
MLKLLYFARLRETFGLAEEELELPAQVINVQTLTELLRQRGEVWEVGLASGKPYRVAVNQEMVGPGTIIRDGDEIAFFPPVTGG